MAHYVIGDIHGCYDTLQRLLERIEWSPQTDQLWLTGDLVNRGPDSLAVLRWAMAHPSTVEATLGNHDVHLLARAVGLRKAKTRDSLEGILSAPDRDELLDWVARRPLVLRAPGLFMMHAGILPAWSLDDAEGRAIAVQALLAGDARTDLIREALSTPDDGPAFDLSVLTNLRIVDADGCWVRRFKQAPQNAPEGCRPWYAARPATDGGVRLVFGHWAAHGFAVKGNALCLDSGCVWGNLLTAVRLDDGALFQQPAG